VLIRWVACNRLTEVALDAWQTDAWHLIMGCTASVLRCVQKSQRLLTAATRAIALPCSHHHVRGVPAPPGLTLTDLLSAPRLLAAITLFEVFLHLLADYSPTTGVPSVWGSIPVIIEDTLK